MSQAASSDSNDVPVAADRVSILPSSTSEHTSAPSTASFFPSRMDHPSVLARRFSYDLLKEITDGFSVGRGLGNDGYGKVYKGVHKDGKTIAVKLLYDMPALDDVQFEREFNNLMSLQHDNIVRLVGYCRETRPEYIQYEGRMVVADRIHRALCFEYAHNGSLDENIYEEHNGHDWHTRYGIIKGICNGLKYMHDQTPPMYHLDIKPANVLLDENMLPKIKGFRSSRLFGEEQTITTESSIGTIGYLPPEFIETHILSNKFDIFSLGVVIIKVMAGHRSYAKWRHMSSLEFLKLVQRNWRARLQQTSVYALEPYYEQVKTCIEIALMCVETDRHKRPTIMEIVDKMNETETKIGSWSHIKMGSKPHHLSLHHLRGITNNFSNERILGRGGFGVVYKGVLQNGKMVAIKKLLQSTPISEEKFENEVDILMKLEHPFIVRLLGYCYETQRLHTPHEGKFVFVWNTETFLCLECVPNGSLNNYISGASSGLDWHTRFKIIEGISYGLQYLHEHFNDPIIHLDLKPANILLDENMMPKITDFGLSRLFNQNQTIHTKNSCGTLGYMSPEYQLRGIITPMADIFSLGVIIMEVITGHRDYPYDIRTSSDRFIKEELQKWRKILLREPAGYTALETDCQQIQRCIQIGLICVNPDRTKRPSMKKIVDMLQGLENLSWYITNELSSHDVQAEPQSSKGDCHDN